MLETLYEAEKALPELLRKGGWQSLLVNYHPPFVERLWLPWLGGDVRISLHLIHPCDPAEALFHPHPWPSAMRLVDGTYSMIVGYSRTHEPPPVAARLILHAPDTYEMTDPDGWHAVVPLERPSYSVMVSGRPYHRANDAPRYKLNPLPPADEKRLLTFFQDRYSTVEQRNATREALGIGHRE